MRLFGRFRSLHIHTYMGHSVPQLTSLSSQPEDFLAMHDESKDNDDTRSFQQFISEPTTISGTIEAAIRLWWCTIAPNKLKTRSYPLSCIKLF